MYRFRLSGPVCLTVPASIGLRPESAEEEYDEANQKDQAKSAAANGGTAKVESAATKQEKEYDNE
jgi:hypothetical protein